MPKKTDKKIGPAKTSSPQAKASSRSAGAPADGVATTSALSEGAAAPAFQLSRDDGGIASLNDYAGRNLVLFFYPRADTPGCTLEASDFNRLATEFARLDTAILGVSADPQPALQRFRNKHALSVGLASDETLATLKAYGVWGQKSLYGKTFEGILRTTVLIVDGRIARIWRNVKVPGHAEAVLAAIRDGFS